VNYFQRGYRTLNAILVPINVHSWRRYTLYVQDENDVQKASHARTVTRVFMTLATLRYKSNNLQQLWLQGACIANVVVGPEGKFKKSQ